jgi:hypothetical protein
MFSCKEKTNENCHYTLEQLINDSTSVKFTYQNDTLTEIRDIGKDSSTYGLYLFDKDKNLRFYAFFVDSKEQYRYSEQYDSIGNLVKKEGSPLVEYRLFKGQKDTVIFDASLFSLNKKYEKIEIISNNLDTINPIYLYKSNFYSNVNSFEFKLPVVNNISSLILTANLEFTNTCNQQKESFRDTVSFKNVEF